MCLLYDAAAVHVVVLYCKHFMHNSLDATQMIFCSPHFIFSPGCCRLTLVQVAGRMRAAGIRVEVMERASIAKMIRTAEKAKTPVMAVVGAKEAEAGGLAVRLYGGSDLGSMPADDVIARIVAANKTRGSEF
jgi:histidyl-tRNA synthetase